MLAPAAVAHQGLSPDLPEAGNSVSSQENLWCRRPASLTSGGPARLNRLLICLGKAGQTREGEEGGLGLCPERGRLSLVALIAEACCLGLAGFGCLAMNKKAGLSQSLYSHVEITGGGVEGEEGFC